MLDLDYLHHWLSHGTPSLFPSILVLAQCSMKYVASAQDVICEQCVRPSQLNAAALAVAGIEPAERGSDGPPFW
jgi:hypothetical protein